MNTDIAKTTENCINCTSARPTPLHTNPMESGPENTFTAQNRKNQKIHDFRALKKGSRFFNIFDPPSSLHPLPQKSKTVGFKWGGGGDWWGSGPKMHWGMRLLEKE